MRDMHMGSLFEITHNYYYCIRRAELLELRSTVRIPSGPLSRGAGAGAASPLAVARLLGAAICNLGQALQSTNCVEN